MQNSPEPIRKRARVSMRPRSTLARRLGTEDPVAELMATRHATHAGFNHSAVISDLRSETFIIHHSAFIISFKSRAVAVYSPCPCRAVHVTLRYEPTPSYSAPAGEARGDSSHCRRTWCV